MIKKLQRFFQSNDTVSKIPSKKLSYLIVIGLVALLLLIVGNVFTSSSQGESEKTPEQMQLENTANQTSTNDTKSTSDVGELEESYQQDLKTMLEKINGVSEVDVMVNLDSTSVKVYEQNLIIGQQYTDENDRNGGTRQIEDNTEETQTVTVRQGDGETPLLVQTKRPEVRGVLVVAKGVDHASVKKWVVEAISRVLDVPTHKVSVMPKN
ncbi:stage III sporulation protein AG [Ornithinibacillus halophilus]|uniref:Stage III sporulation protein AG n=1 Tax=Ornithinibacillus halophilus TaxID=930117 RepID=A0A1M5CYF1_9BACI|nr:stage III sporulation protein AG [Ornithinibacillus halophilus]SHF59813.1 stage III sporulation protein AG [Ornithinibacillus halophilus]